MLFLLEKVEKFALMLTKTNLFASNYLLNFIIMLCHLSLCLSLCLPHSVRVVFIPRDLSLFTPNEPRSFVKISDKLIMFKQVFHHCVQMCVNTVNGLQIGQCNTLTWNINPKWNHTSIYKL